MSPSYLHKKVDFADNSDSGQEDEEKSSEDESISNDSYD